MSVGARSRRIDMLRGASILLVLLHHFNIAYSLRDTVLSRWPGWGVVHAVVRNGNYAVVMFFAISGFLITGNALQRWGSLGRVEPGRFWALRAARILPCLLLLVALVTGLGVVGVAGFGNVAEQGPPVSFWVVGLAALTSWMNVLMDRAGWVNYVLCVLWSLSVEEAFYLSFPLACRLLRREGLVAAFWGLAVVAGPLWRMTHQDDEAEFLYAYLACFDAIAIGCWAALLSARALPPPGTGWRRFLPAGQVATGAAMAAFWLAWPIQDSNVFGVTLMALGTGVLLLGTHAPAAGARGGAAEGALRWFGRRSYELYLFHLVVLATLRCIAPPGSVGAGGLVFLAAYLAGSALLAEAVARAWSEPANRAIRRRLPRRAAMSAA